MPGHHPLQCRQIAIQRPAVVEGHLAHQKVGIALRCQQVVKQDTVLQRRQPVNVLHVLHPALNAGHHPVNLRLGQGD
ncbi:Uncharacterised protein [Acinetobacter baumannii]|nr:Uncharacterised protein [Acinetobacter baumannii]